MKGKYRITLQATNSTVKYELEVSRQITIVCGESGIGKTLLHKLVSKYYSEGELSKLNLKVDSECVNIEPFVPQLIREDNSKFVFKDRTKKLKWLSKPDNIIYLIDEDVLAIKGINFASLIRHTNAYYVIFTREARVFRYLYNSVWDVLTIKDNGDKDIDNECYRMYKEFDGNIGKYDEVVHEDSTTGKEICSLALQENIISSKGNARIPCIINERYRDKSVIIIADGSNFSNIMERLLKRSLDYNITMYLILPESTEYVLLHNVIFNKSENATEYLLNPINKYDTKNWITYEKMYEQVIIEESSKIDELEDYEKIEGLRTYKTESFIDTYRAILNKIDGIKSSYNIKYSLYKIVNGKLVEGDTVNKTNINLLDEKNSV